MHEADATGRGASRRGAPHGANMAALWSSRRPRRDADCIRRRLVRGSDETPMAAAALVCLNVGFPPSADIRAGLVAFGPYEVQPSRMMQRDQTGRDEAQGLPAAEVTMRVGRNANLDVRVTSVGLLSIGILVSGILLSTAVLVRAAKRRVKA